MDQNKDMIDFLQSDSTLHIVAQSIVDSVNQLYCHLDELKQNASTRSQIAQLNSVQTKIDSIATKALAESQNLKNGVKISNVELEIKNLKQQLDLLQKKHEELAQKHEDLEKRVTDLECTMVSRQQFEDLKRSCQKRFSLFENRFSVMWEQNNRLFLFVDEQFKRRIKPTDQFKRRLSELMKTNYRLFEYSKKLYWSLINQILAYRTLSSGMVQKGSMKTKYEESTLFKEIASVLGSATYLIAGVPLVGGIFLVVKDLASVFFNRQEEAVTSNMCMRVEGYFTEDQISEDVARAVLELISHPNVEARLAEFQTKTMIASALCKFFQFISTADISPQLLADIFVSKLSRVRKEKQSPESSFLTENIITDTSLIIWKMAQSPPAEKRFAVSSAVKALFSKNTSGNTVSQPFSKLHSSTINGTIQELQNSYFTENYTMKSSAGSNETKFFLDMSKVEKQNNKNGQNFPIYQITKNIQNTNLLTQTKNQANNSSQNPYFKLKIVLAEMNLKKQLFRRLNVYCVIKYRNRVMRTQNQKTQDIKVKWDQQFILEIGPTASTITFQIYGKERLFQDELIGSATVIDSQISQIEQEIELWCQTRSIGKIILCLHP